MALQNATYTGREQILEAFDAVTQEGNLYFSVWHSVDHIAFQWPYNDMTKGRDFLDKNLSAMEQAGNDNLLYLKFHPETGVKQGDYIDKKTKVVSMSPVRVVPVDASYEPAGNREVVYQGNREPHIPQKLYDTLTALNDSIRPLNEKIIDIDTRLKEIETAEYEEAPQTVVGQIGELLTKNPEIGNAVISQIPGILTMITNALKSFLPAQPPMAVIPQAINGTAEQQPAGDNEPMQLDKVDEKILNDALIRLAKQGVKIDTDLLKLAEMAENNKPMFDMLLMQLRG